MTAHLNGNDTLPGLLTPNGITRRIPWLIGSPKYQEFIDICTRVVWQVRDHLRRAGSTDARESGLEAFIANGNGDGKAFSRSQVNAKFAHWKSTSLLWWMKNTLFVS